MKISELKIIAKENDYEIKESIDKYRLTHKYCDNYISINGLYKNRLWISIPFCCDERDFNMIKAAVKFAETPPEDREEEKKFYLRHRWMEPRPIDKNYLNHWIGTNEYWLDYDNETKDVQTQFTLKEIDEIKEKFNTGLGDFKKNEVKE